MKYKHILITGGAGFIGSHLADYLINNNYKVRILDNLHPQIHPTGKPPAYLNPKAQFLRGDVVNRKDWLKALKNIDAVFHFAAAVGVGQSMYEIERYVKDNCLGTAIFLDILANKKHIVKKIIVAGSMSSFGEGIYKCLRCRLIQQPPLRKVKDLEKGNWEPACRNCQIRLEAIPTDELARLESPSVYAITKKTQEDLFLAVGKAYNIPAVSLKFFNAYGSRQSLSNPYNGVAAIFLSRVKNGKPPLINEDGYQTRDFIHINDMVKICELALIRKEADYQMFNVGSGIATSINEVAKVCLKLYNSKLKPEVTGKFRTFDVRHCFADTLKMKQLLGYTPKIGFTQGMKGVYEWSKNEKASDLVDKAMKELEKRGLR